MPVANYSLNLRHAPIGFLPAVDSNRSSVSLKPAPFFGPLPMIVKESIVSDGYSFGKKSWSSLATFSHADSVCVNTLWCPAAPVPGPGALAAAVI